MATGIASDSQEKWGIATLLQVRIGICFVGLIAVASQTVQAVPPFRGTIFIDPDIITSSDPTTLQSVSYVGRGFRLMYDRRVGWTNVNAYLFNASFDDGLTSEIQVNPEFASSDAALTEAQTYGEVIGRLPIALRADVATVWIHQGIRPFGGGNNNLLIHTGQADRYAADGILEETLVHEAAHTSLDAAHASAPDWLAAQTADDEFISTYARDNPGREDVAESFLPWIAVRHRSTRINTKTANIIEQTIPSRLAYFNGLSLDMTPITVREIRRGDFNNDSLLTAEDIDQLSAAIRAGTQNVAFDLNSDDNVDEVDREVWVEELAGTFFGDGDLNKEVAFADFLALSSNFGLDGGWANGDFDGSGTVLFPDFLLLSSNFGKSAPAASAVPEPNAAMLLLAGLVGFVRRRSIVSQKVWLR